MPEELVAITRQDGRLSAIVSRAVVEEGKPRQYAVAEVPVESVRTSDPGARTALDVWPTLAEVRLDDADCVASAIGILLATVPVGAPGSGVSRADGRAWLCEPVAWPRLRAALAARPGRVLRALRAQGWTAAVERLPSARDPYAAYHHAAPDVPALQSLPPRFRALVLPRLRGRDWTEVGRALSLYWTFDRGSADPRLAALVRLLGRHHGFEWLELIACSPPEWHETVLDWVNQTSLADPRALPRSLFDGFGLADPGGDLDRLDHLLRELTRGVPAGEALEEIRCAAAYAPAYRFACPWRPVVPRHPRLPDSHAQRVVRLLDRLLAAGVLDEHVAFAPRLWRWSTFPENAPVLARPSLLSWPPETTRAVLDSLMLRRSRDCTVGARARWFEDLLERVPASHHSRAIAEGARVLEHVSAGSAAQALSIVEHLSRPPYPARLDGPGVASLLALAGSERSHAVRSLPQRTLVRLERALAEDHGIEPLWYGLFSLARRVPRLFWDALSAHPEPLMAAARELGLLHPARRRLALKRFRAHPVAQRRFERRPLEAVCAAIERAVALGLPSPIPRRLRAHRAGACALSTGSLERHRQAIVRRLLPFRLGLLRLLALDDARRGVHADLRDEGERHAVLMLAGVKYNKRLLRRVLRVPPGDRARFLAEHPANRAWTARHPAATHAAWSGEEAVRTGALRLALERDPLEVLRIGTRVGSCLALGGCNDEAAVASMADANKRVVIARDERGVFVARQRIALTENDRLACAPVYPLGVPAAVAEAFVAYDRRLAERLGVPLVRPGEDYAVVDVLSRSDYDDGVWSALAEAP